MATYVLIHGAGSDSTTGTWSSRGCGRRATTWWRSTSRATTTRPALAEYRDTVLDAIGDRTDLVLVAQSMAGFTAPLVCERVPVELTILVAAMVPAPGESPGDWWANTGLPEAQQE